MDGVPSELARIYPSRSSSGGGGDGPGAAPCAELIAQRGLPAPLRPQQLRPPGPQGGGAALGLYPPEWQVGGDAHIELGYLRGPLRPLPADWWFSTFLAERNPYLSICCGLWSPAPGECTTPQYYAPDFRGSWNPGYKPLLWSFSSDPFIS